MLLLVPCHLGPAHKEGDGDFGSRLVAAVSKRAAGHSIPLGVQARPLNPCARAELRFHQWHN